MLTISRMTLTFLGELFPGEQVVRSKIPANRIVKPCMSHKSWVSPMKTSSAISLRGHGHERSFFGSSNFLCWASHDLQRLLDLPVVEVASFDITKHTQQHNFCFLQVPFLNYLVT
ncbi:hypothetical protein DVH05_010779 [Phytophthora capsici]|nr:hypothetical protein DVH05_010779 [Phytophthora capsici]